MNAGMTAGADGYVATLVLRYDAADQEDADTYADAIVRRLAALERARAVTLAAGPAPYDEPEGEGTTT